MNAITTITPEGQIDLSFISEGFHTFTAAQANIVLRECHFDGQRGISKDHVSVLADIMKRGKWEEKDKLDFAVLHGRPILVNGYHRMQAQIASGKSVRWTVVTHQCRSMEDVRALYFRFDTNTRLRNGPSILNAIDFSQKAALSKQFAEALYRAIPIIANGFSDSPKDKDILAAKVIDRRMAIAQDYIAAAQKYEAATSGATMAIKKKLLSAGVFSVAVVTFRDQPVTAAEFWSQVAVNDGLRKGDPRQTLHMHLIAGSVRGAGGRSIRNSFGPSICWNAFFEGRDLQLVKIYEGRKITIAGTAFEE